MQSSLIDATAQCSPSRQRSPAARQSQIQAFNNDPHEEDAVQISILDREEAHSLVPKPGLPELAFRAMVVTQSVILALGILSAYLVLHIKTTDSSQLFSYKSWYSCRTLFFLGIFVFDAYKVFEYKDALFGKFRPHLRLLGSNVPSVDIVICCCNEEISIVKNTILAALNLDYPSNRFRILVSDDGSSFELAQLVARLATVNPKLYYTARKKEGPPNFKAGNLNHAASVLTDLPSGPAEMIAGLDADMIPDKHWLRAVLPHLLEDSDLGLANPPQVFYNTPVNDPLAQSLVCPTHGMDIVRDMGDIAVCNGSGWVMRRQCLDEVGGFPYGSLTEDIYFAVLLNKAGWKTAYVPEPLQHGLVPETFKGHVRQFARWNIGFAQIGLQIQFCLNPWRSGQLSLGQRYTIGVTHFNAFIPLLHTAIPITAIVLLVIRPGYVFGLLHDLPLDDKRRLLGIQILGILLNMFLTLQQAIFQGWSATLALSNNHTWMAPYHAYELLKLFPVWQLFGSRLVFTATGSLQSEVNERSAKLRSSLWPRLKAVLWGNSAAFHLIFIFLGLVGLLRSSILASTTCNLVGQVICEEMISVHMVSVPLLQLIVAYCVPILYVLFPPTVEDDCDLVQHEKPIDGKSSAIRGSVANYPTKSNRTYKWSLSHDFNSYFYLISRMYSLWKLVMLYRLLRNDLAA